MKIKKVSNIQRYENFCLLRLFKVFMDLKYEEYEDFCDFDDEHELFNDDVPSSLENDYCDDVHQFGYRSREKYLAEQIREAKKNLKCILKEESGFNLYAVGAA